MILKFKLLLVISGLTGIFSGTVLTSQLRLKNYEKHSITPVVARVHPTPQVLSHATSSGEIASPSALPKLKTEVKSSPSPSPTPVQTLSPSPSPTTSQANTNVSSPTPTPSPSVSPSPSVPALEACYTHNTDPYFYQTVHFDASCSKGDIVKYEWFLTSKSQSGVNCTYNDGPGYKCIFTQEFDTQFLMPPIQYKNWCPGCDPEQMVVNLKVIDKDGKSHTIERNVKMSVPDDRLEDKWW